MEYLVADLSALPKIILFNKETLINGATHKSRTAQEYIMYYVLSGELRLIDNNKEVTLKKGDLHIFFKGEYHCPTEITDCQYIYLHFDGEFSIQNEDNITETIKTKHCAFLTDSCITPVFDTVIFLPKNYHVISSSLHKMLISAYNNNQLDLSKGKEDFSRTLTAFKISEIFIEIYRTFSSKVAYKAQPPAENLVNAVANYISKNYAQKITGAMLQEIFGYNFDYMNRCFKSATGKTVFTYLQEERIKNAACLLKIKNISISQVANDCGFCDIYYFSRTFKKHLGCSPRKYIQNEAKMT